MTTLSHDTEAIIHLKQLVICFPVIFRIFIDNICTFGLLENLIKFGILPPWQLGQRGALYEDSLEVPAGL